jgi:hypothetical protein
MVAPALLRGGETRRCDTRPMTATGAGATVRRGRLLLVLFAAVTALIAALLPATPASAATGPAAEKGVGAIHVELIFLVGVHESVSAGGHRVRGPSLLQVVSAHCVPVNLTDPTGHMPCAEDINGNNFCGGTVKTFGQALARRNRGIVTGVINNLVDQLHSLSANASCFATAERWIYVHNGGSGNQGRCGDYDVLPSLGDSGALQGINLVYDPNPAGISVAEFFSTLLGIKDFKHCAGGDAGGCALAASTFVPWGKIADLGRLARLGEEGSRLDLAAHEGDSLGHTLARHVDVTDEDLLARLAANPKLQNASRFLDRATAESAIGALLDASRDEITSWLAAQTDNPLELNGALFADVIGRTANQGSQAVVDVNGLRAVLFRNADTGPGFFIRTAYPQPGP